MTALLRVLLVLLLMSSANAVAEEDVLSGNDMYPGCKALVEKRAYNEKIMGEANFCSGMLTALAFVAPAINNPDVRSCPPSSTSALQTARVVLKYLDEHPERMHEDFRQLAIEAFHRAWPCRAP